MIKHAEKIGNGAVQDLKVGGPSPSNKDVGKTKFGMRTNEGRLISRFSVKEWKF